LNLLSSDGHPFKCLQRQIDVDDARDAAQAGEAATCIFQADRHIGDWQLGADVRAVEPPAEIASDHPAGLMAYWHCLAAKASGNAPRHHVRRRSLARDRRASAG
jgi:hypothetical protein